MAGCHLGLTKDGKLNGRMFGEACLEGEVLVESNPGAGVVHLHKEDTGHPDKFDCLAWCQAQGAEEGVCVVVPAPPCESLALCLCG